MPYKDPNKRREANRSYQRQIAAAEQPRTKFPEELRSQRPIRNVTDVLSRVDIYLQLLESGEMPVATRCRTAKELLSVAIKALEVADLGGRIKRIEELMRQKGLSLPVAAPAPAQDEEETETIQ